MNNDHFFRRTGRPRTARQDNIRRAAIAARVMSPPDLTPAPAGTTKALRTAWRAFTRKSLSGAVAARRDVTPMLGRVRSDIRGSLTSLRRGDVVLVWDDQPQARSPIYTTWHPRNDILTNVHKDQVDLISEDPGRLGVIKTRGRREDAVRPEGQGRGRARRTSR